MSCNPAWARAPPHTPTTTRSLIAERPPGGQAEMCQGCPIFHLLPASRSLLAAPESQGRCYRTSPTPFSYLRHQGPVPTPCPLRRHGPLSRLAGRRSAGGQARPIRSRLAAAASATVTSRSRDAPESAVRTESLAGAQLPSAIAALRRHMPQRTRTRAVPRVRRR